MSNLYSLLVDPTTLFLLFIVGIIGIYVEISHPGLLVPGIVGTLCLLLFLFGSLALTPNWFGLVLMLLALALLILDVNLPTHGILTIGAVISLIAGTLLFFNSGGRGTQINPLVVYPVSALVGALGLYVAVVVVRTRHARVTTGVEGMIGATVTALTPLLPEGNVSYGGENWSAVLDPPARTVTAGTILRIVSVDGLVLHVQLPATLPSSLKPDPH